MGRGGSDTTAVAIASALKLKKCYIYSDVDGVYTADPKKIKNSKKIHNISYKEMLELTNEGAKVLHNRSVQIAKKFKVPIIAKSTFNDESGTEVSDEIENNEVKSTIKKEISRISIIGNNIIENHNLIKQLLDFIKENNLQLITIEISTLKITLTFKNMVEDTILTKLHQLIFEK